MYRKDTEPFYHSFMYSLLSIMVDIWSTFWLIVMVLANKSFHHISAINLNKVQGLRVSLFLKYLKKHTG